MHFSTLVWKLTLSFYLTLVPVAKRRLKVIETLPVCFIRIRLFA
jgi:hypothetical protein